jgi:hypothetical protein
MSMADKAARPRRVMQNDQLDTLLRLRRDFAVLPDGMGNERWCTRMRAANVKTSEEQSEEEKDKRLIRDMSKGVNGIEFAAEELAKVIRGWMNQDD